MKCEKDPVTLESKQPMNPILIIAIILVVVGFLTYIIPAGHFDRVLNEKTGYDTLDVDSFQFVEGQPVGFLAFFKSLTVGMQSAAPIIFFLLIIGGTFQIVEHTGALKASLANMVRVLKGKDPCMRFRMWNHFLDSGNMGGIPGNSAPGLCSLYQRGI